MTEEGRALGGDDVAALDELLAEAGLAGTFARHQLAIRRLGDGLYTYGWPREGGLGAALVASESICWLVWRDRSILSSIARVLRGRSYELLSAERSHVEPVLSLLPLAVWRDQDRCPFEALVPEALQIPSDFSGPAPRQATLDDMEPLIDFYGRGFYSLARLPSRDAWRRRLTQQLTYRTIFIAEQSGVVRAAAMSSAETPAHAILGGVATIDAYRNKGYSTAVVGALCEHLFATGHQEIGLFYMPGNTPAARVYAKLGFVPRGEWWLTRLKPAI